MCKPNTGWFSLVLASQICNSVDMYGFENYKYNTHMTRLTKYHYFDDVVGQTNVHSFNLTLTIFRCAPPRGCLGLPTGVLRGGASTPGTPAKGRSVDQ